MKNNRDFLGTGWSFPPTFNQNTARVEMVSDELDIAQSLEIILSTYPAERVMQPNFGCDLRQFLFEELSQSLITGIRGMITDAILYHEPRINLNTVDINESQEAGLLLISITYTVRTTNSRFNLVYPFYINETQSL